MSARSSHDIEAFIASCFVIIFSCEGSASARAVGGDGLGVELFWMLRREFVNTWRVRVVPARPTLKEKEGNVGLLYLD